jgi:hypothetical protein
MSRQSFTCTPGASQNATSYMGIVNQFHDALIAVGFLRTGDTGQINLAATPTLASNTLIGYSIYELNDALSGTAPIYLRIEFWAYGANLKFAVSAQIARATDGAGTLVGTLGSAVAASYSSTNINTTTLTAYVSRSEGAFAIYFAGGSTSSSTGYMNYPMFMAFERARALDGSLRGDAIFWVRFGSGSPTSISSAAWVYAYRYADSENLGNLHPGSLVVPNVFSAGVGVGGGIVPMFFPGLVWAPGIDPWQPTVVAGVPGNDNPGTPFDVEVYGVAREYFAPDLGPIGPSISSPVYIGVTQQSFITRTLAWLWEA